MKEEEIRHHVRKQRCFYAQAFEIGIFNIVLILVWLLFSTGAGFWPKYVIIVSLIWLAIKGYNAGLMPFFKEKVCAAHCKLRFMSDDWEEEKVEEMMGKKTKKTSPKPKKKAAPQKKVVGRTKKKS